MKTVAVIGKNFGDEGKGLACASLSKSVQKTLIIKHNGGGQAGHTVEDKSGNRFVHHQIGSGAQYGAATLLADTFYADLYQLREEINNFRNIYGFSPLIFADKNAYITVIDDVLRNMFIESSRGDSRHGSCGMGIDECQKRIESGYGITLQEVSDLPETGLLDRLRKIRNEYGSKDLEKIRDDFEHNNPGEETKYYEMLKDDDILASFASYLKIGMENVILVEPTSEWLQGFEQIVFETGQGLLLDQDYELYAPHLTSSKTGLHNIVQFLQKKRLPLDEVIYVSRTYVTRHGNGPLPCEIRREELPGILEDMTNVDNEWQGSIRYARHESIKAFVNPMLEDMRSVKDYSCMKDTTASVLLTHLNETDRKVCFEIGDIPVEELMDIIGKKEIAKIYTSYDRYETDI